MKKWLFALAAAGLLAILAFTARWWAPALLGFVTDNSDTIQGLTDFLQLLLWAGAAAAAAAIAGLWRGRRRPEPSTPPQAQAQAFVAGGGAVGQGHSTVGGQGSIVATQVSDSALATGPGARAIKADTYVEHQHLPDPEATRRAEARERYLRRLRQRCNVLPLAAMGGEEDAGDEVTLDRVYVELDTRTRALRPGEEPGHRNEARQALGRPEQEDRALPALEAATLTPRLVLLGDPGGGKSTFVRQLAAWLAAAQLGDTDPPIGWPADTLPLLVALRELTPALASLALDGLSDRARDQRLVETVRQHWHAQLKDLAAEAFMPDVERALDTGTVLLVFDGLDEVPERLRRRVRLAVQSVRTAYPKVRHIVVTCRIRSYGGNAVLPGFDQHTLAAFDAAKIRRFVEGWYRAQATLGRMSDDAAGDKTKDLQQAALSADLSELASNPMLLTTMAIIHQKEVGLPRERVRLYKLAVENLLLRWQRQKGIAVSDTLAALLRDDLKLRRIVEDLAYWVHEREAAGREDGALSRSDLLALLEKPKYLGSAGLASEFLDYVDQRAGLLVGHGGDEEQDYPLTYSFPHRTFREYLAGCHMVEGRGIAREYWRRAAEKDFWVLAARYGAEELKYNSRGGEKELLDLAYDLCPAAAPGREVEWRAVLWSGQIAALLNASAILDDTAKPEGGQAYLERLLPRIEGVLRHSPLPAIERADAGRVLARLGDRRPGVGVDPATGLPDVDWLPVPAGPFRMGEGGEQFEYTLPYDYRIGRYPVTNAQYAAFVQAGGYRTPAYWQEAESHGYWRPAGQVKRRVWDLQGELRDEFAGAPAD